MSEPLDICLHDLLMVKKRYLQDNHQEISSSDALTARFTKHHHPDYDKLCPFFLNVPAETVKHTLNNTTQYACHSLSGPDMYKTHKSPQTVPNKLYVGALLKREHTCSEAVS